MFFVGVLPALLVLYIRAHVPESPAFKTLEKKVRPGLVATLKKNVGLSIYAIILMTAFNLFSHGSQDLYPTFLRVQRQFDAHTVSWITITLNIGAICGGLFFGWASEKIGRKRAIFISALIALPVLPLWAFSTTPMLLALGAFLMQISVQGAWGVIPVHLNEISPDEIRATFPGLVYQLGNLIASVNGPLQAKIAEMHNNDYALVMAVVIGIVALVICALIPFSRERRGIDMTSVAHESAGLWVPLAHRHGLMTGRFEPAEAGAPGKLAALMFDASGIDDSSLLEPLHGFFHDTLRSLGKCGRIVVLGRPPEACASPRQWTAQRALEGLVRSLGKEARRGITANLVYVEESAENAIEATLRFFLSPRSAYVSGQVVRIAAHAAPRALRDDARRSVPCEARGVAGRSNRTRA